MVSARREIAAAPDVIFELIADPAQQPRWDGNGNLTEAAAGQRVHAVGDVFRMWVNSGTVRENHIVEFEEGRRIAWLPSEEGKAPPGHLWRWEIEPLGDGHSRVTHTYDWTNLTEEKRLKRAQGITADNLAASIERLATLSEGA
ncbi:SRPBCC family protein [Mycolicibacterium frederiksbergense]|uniref:SRPBCC family protein n=1 Tax=Mycolicibacterium frederiksbergense TaxID=117567 RepID=UPI00399C2A38